MLGQSLSWFWEGGSVALPKRLFALMGPLGLSFEDIGYFAYLMQCEGQIAPTDHTGRRIAEHFSRRGLIEWEEEHGHYHLTPLFERIDALCGGASSAPSVDPSVLYVALLKKAETERCYYLSEPEKKAIMRMIQEFHWDEDLIWVIFSFYQDEMKKRRYSLERFALLAKQAGVSNVANFEHYAQTMTWQTQKLREVLKRIGKYHNPTTAQQEMYEKWQHQWMFSHEMILLAADETINADNPNLSYIDRVLANWHSADIHTPEAIVASREERQRQKQLGREKKRVKRTVNNRDFNLGSPRDLSGLEE